MHSEVLTISLPSGSSFDMILVEGGEFLMGGQERKDARIVKVDSFYLGKYQVTQVLWHAVMGNNPSAFKGENRPVEYVSRNDVIEFIKKLNKMTSKRFRLPSEAEWEFAARGGIYSQGYDYCGSDKLKQVGWYDENSNKETHDVGLLLPNELGIYDMSGNVWEWCEDKAGALRGGSYYFDAGGSRPMFRVRYTSGSRYEDFGFRMALSLQSVG